MKKLLLILIIICAVTTGCNRNDLPQRPEENTGLNGGSVASNPEPDVPDNPSRPGNGINNIDIELADTVYRFVSQVLTLKYTDGGVLFSCRPDRSWSIIDLDGSDRIEFSPGPVAPDSILTSPNLTVNNQLIKLLHIKMFRTSQNARWYAGLASDSSSIIIVTPNQ